MYKIKSAYRLRVISLLQEYGYLPCTKNGLEMLITAYPELENSKKFTDTYRKLKQDGWVKKIRVFPQRANQRDAIELTYKGETFLSERSGQDYEESRGQLLSGRRERDKKFKLRIAEAMLFFAPLNMSYEERRFVLFYTKTYVFKAVENFCRRRTASKESLLGIRNSRVVGVLETDYTAMPVYNVKDANIEIKVITEKNMMRALDEAYQKPMANSYKKIILADSEAILDKTILLEKEIIKVKEDGSIKKNSHIFEKDMHGEYEELYLLFNRVEQRKLALLFMFPNTENRINSFIRETAEKILTGGNHFRDDKKRTFAHSVYETEEEIGISIVQQELASLFYHVERLKKNQTGTKTERRRVVIYGVKENKEIYDKLFSQFDYCEFREIDFYELFDYIEYKDSLT